MMVATVCMAWWNCLSYAGTDLASTQSVGAGAIVELIKCVVPAYECPSVVHGMTAIR